MAKKNHPPIILPALRGIMGDWAFYSCLMSMKELANRVSYADEIHENKNLSDMIQRKLEGGRSRQIASYIENQSERFFNSLVVATYGGEPNWLPIGSVKTTGEVDGLEELPDDTISSVGFLTFNGSENLFAIDGQHRLSGIKQAVKSVAKDAFKEEEISVLFVAHQSSIKGMERTRRLFTTLNKTAKPVTKGDIIALDEDDVMAITVRNLVERTDSFSGEKIAFVATNNMPSTNKKSITTIGNLYDVLTILFTKVVTKNQKKKEDLIRVRPDEEVLSGYFSLAQDYFKLMGENFSEVAEFFAAKDTNKVVEKYRGKHGGSILFRPVGQTIFAQIIERLTNEGLRTHKAMELASKLPTDLTKRPYCDLVWSTSAQTISGANLVTTREVLLHMVGHSKMSEKTLIDRYRKATGDDEAQLPKSI